MEHHVGTVVPSRLKTTQALGASRRLLARLSVLPPGVLWSSSRVPCHLFSFLGICRRPFFPFLADYHTMRLHNTEV